MELVSYIYLFPRHQICIWHLVNKETFMKPRVGKLAWVRETKLVLVARLDEHLINLMEFQPQRQIMPFIWKIFTSIFGSQRLKNSKKIYFSQCTYSGIFSFKKQSIFKEYTYCCCCLLRRPPPPPPTAENELDKKFPS